MVPWAAVLSVFTAALFALSPAKALDAGLIGDWTFDEGSGRIAADHSGNGNDGILVAAGRAKPEWGTEDFKGSLKLNGGWGAYVQVPPSQTLNSVTTAITVAALVYPRELWELGDKHSGFIALAQRQWREERHPDQFYLGYGVKDNKLTYKWHIGLLDDDDDLSLYSLPLDRLLPPTEQWIFIAGTYDGSSGRMALLSVVRSFGAIGGVD